MALRRSITVILANILLMQCTTAGRQPSGAPRPAAKMNSACDLSGQVTPTTVTNCAAASCQSLSIPTPCDPSSCQEFPSPPPMDATSATLKMQKACADGSALPGFQNPQYMYNGAILPPRLNVLDGQTISLSLHNCDSDRTYDYTNLHYHGMNVSPINPPKFYSDNVFVQIGPKTVGHYRVPVPKDHPRGTFWYHPHPHLQTEPQILGGMSGIIAVGRIVETYYGDTLGGLALDPNFDRALLLRDYVPGGASAWAGPGCAVKSVNGLASGKLTLPTLTPQLLRVANVSANQFFDLQIVSAANQPQPMYVIAIDGNPTLCDNAGTLVACPIAMTDLFLPPGSRMDVLVQLDAGTYSLSTLEVQTDADPNCAQQLGWVLVTGDTPKQQYDLTTLRSTVAVTNRRSYAALETAFNAQQTPCTTPKNAAAPGPQDAVTIPFSQPQPNTFSIVESKLQYEMSRLDMQVNSLPCVAKWTITNNDQEMHVFHIHQVDFLVEDEPICTQSNQPCVLYRDTLAVAPGQSTTVLIPFDEYAAGAFVYHCHIANHEDLGMMANICAPGSGVTCNSFPPSVQMQPKQHH